MSSNSRFKVCFFLLGILIVCPTQATAEGTPLWEEYLIQSEECLYNVRYVQAMTRVDKAISLLQEEDNRSALAEAYFLKAALQLFSNGSEVAVKESIVNAIRFAPSGGIPDKDYLMGDPRIRDFYGAAMNELKGQVERFVKIASGLYEGRQYCECKEMLQSIEDYSQDNIVAMQLLTSSRNMCREVKGGVESGPTWDSADSSVGGLKVGVLPIHVVGQLNSSLSGSETSNWVKAVSESFKGYNVQFVQDVDMAVLKREYNIKGYNEFLVRKYQINAGWNFWANFLSNGHEQVRVGVLPPNSSAAMGYIMEQGNYSYIVVSSLEAQGKSGESLIFRVNLYGAADLTKPQKKTFKKFRSQSLKTFKYYGELAMDIIPN